MKLSHTGYQRLSAAWWLLKLAYGAFFIWSGTYKLLGSVEPLFGMVSPSFKSLIPLSLTDFFTFFAWAEVIIGFMILTVFTRVGACLGALLVLAISVNLFMMDKFFTLGVNNLVIAAALIALALLTGAKKHLYE
jgi:hypothetical protein